MSTEDKDRWKKEAKQLKDDLDNRQKVVKKREVEISFGKKKASSSKPKAQPKSNDDWSRQQLGL